MPNGKLSKTLSERFLNRGLLKNAINFLPTLKCVALASVLNSLLGQFIQRMELAKAAIRQPPVWSSIDDLEADWGIDDSNRSRYLRLQWAYIGLLSLVLISIVIGVFSFRPGSALLLVASLLISTASCLVLLVVASISLWRIEVLMSRRVHSYPDWLRLR